MPALLGQPAPAFTLPDQNGQPVALQDFAGKNLVLFFYPKSGTPGCTAESCAFRDQYEAFRDAGAEVIGISSDSVENQQAFVNQHRLPYLVLSDQSSIVRKAYGVPKTFGILPGRVTYVINREGVIRHIFNSQFNSQAHITEALKVLKTLI